MNLLRSLALPIVFACLAGVMAADAWPYRRPYGEAVPAPNWAIDATPVRTPTLRPEIQIAGYTYHCADCHSLFPSPPETERTLTQHREIVLAHGINKRCFNCHNIRDRNTFADDKGDPIPYDQPPLLCAKCHGPVYRDWTHGAHGRTNGYWDTSRGPQQRRKCVECHDPHAPAFPAMHPAPAPNTLRMGDQRPTKEGVEETRNPLLIYRQHLQSPQAGKEGPPNE